MSAYIQALQKEVQQHQAAKAKAEAERVASANGARFTPLVDRLRAFIESLPPEEKAKPHSLEFFRRALRGRQGRAAQAGEVGEALRSLRYTRHRGWSSADSGFRAVWLPPIGREN